jgi:hypothetical protein
MTAQNNLNQQQFQFTHISANDVPEGDHMLLAHNGNPRDFAGVLTWDNNTVQNVGDHEDHQRKGLATEMWRQARQISPDIAHSNDRTQAGEAWSKSAGGPRPPRLYNSAGN